MVPNPIPPNDGRANTGYDFVWLPLSRIRIDMPYQRIPNERRVREMAANFDPDLLNPLHVSDRGDGFYYCFDGGHRVAMLRLLGWQDQLVPCLRYLHLTYEDEADLFVELNRKPQRPSTLTTFRGAVEAKKPWALAIMQEVQAVGFFVKWKHGERGRGAVQAVGSLERIYRWGGTEQLRTVLQTIQRAWNGDPDSLRSEILIGLHWIFAIRGPEVDRGHLVRRLQRESPLFLYRAARADASSGEIGFRVAKQILNVYNKHLVKYKLQDLGDAPHGSNGGKMRQASRPGEPDDGDDGAGAPAAPKRS